MGVRFQQRDTVHGRVRRSHSLRKLSHRRLERVHSIDQIKRVVLINVSHGVSEEFVGPSSTETISGVTSVGQVCVHESVMAPAPGVDCSGEKRRIYLHRPVGGCYMPVDVDNSKVERNLLR